MQDICHRENALVKALPKVAAAAESVEFKPLVEDHLAETASNKTRKAA